MISAAASASSSSATHGVRRCFLDSTMELRWVTRRSRSRNPKVEIPMLPGPPSIPICISAKSSHADPRSVRDLFVDCDLSCHRFPKLGHDGRVVVEGDFLEKLGIALANSSVVVSVFCRPEDLVSGDSEAEVVNGRELGFGRLMSRVAPSVGPGNGKLIGFGRAVSDLGLTASIYDVMVTPRLRGMGIGKMVVKRLIRILTSKDIYDIAALCSESQRPFFQACGFCDDVLCSTTMMYTRRGSLDTSEDQLVKHAGRKLLLVPLPTLKR
ncbi:hypothetical protein MLD38_038207 [Melastoma candidum]|uniref:Uncharacterized protein n=1 Tax=Melastoma candidum TaxID=119954 RepID=A0ACB9KZC6_9MYRT|nr:hypothetical protein MLD38_038207 [Melastoma candidum]